MQNVFQVVERLDRALRKPTESAETVTKDIFRTILLVTADRVIRVDPGQSPSNSVDSPMGQLPITFAKLAVLEPFQIKVWFAKIVTDVLEGVKPANRVRPHKIRLV